MVLRNRNGPVSGPFPPVWDPGPPLRIWGFRGRPGRGESSRAPATPGVDQSHASLSQPRKRNRAAARRTRRGRSTLPSLPVDVRERAHGARTRRNGAAHGPAGPGFDGQGRRWLRFRGSGRRLGPVCAPSGRQPGPVGTSLEGGSTGTGRKYVLLILIRARHTRRLWGRLWGRLPERLSFRFERFLFQNSAHLRRSLHYTITFGCMTNPDTARVIVCKRKHYFVHPKWVRRGGVG